MGHRPADWLRMLDQGDLDRPLGACYGAADIAPARHRLESLLTSLAAACDPADTVVVHAPGRTELGGNHTDHNHGRVLAAAVTLDCLAAAAPSGDSVATIHSAGFADPIVVDLSDTAPRQEEEGKPEAFIRGAAHWLAEAGHAPAGFTACVHSTIPMGAGLSSSAAFGVLAGRILSHLFHAGRIDPLAIARAARKAENIHFNKPCGFMDQIASSFMGVLAVDFQDAENPAVRRVHHAHNPNLRLCVVDTGGSHADLTPEYAACRIEMHNAARVLDRAFVRGLDMDTVLAAMPELRQRAGDRAVLRVMHFIEEDRRAQAQAEALESGDMQGFLELTQASGQSSWKLLQNVAVSGHSDEQPLVLALALAERFLAEGYAADGFPIEGRRQGACRMHGGGFAGTIQAWVPAPRFRDFRALMDSVFGAGATIPLRIRDDVGECIAPKDEDATETNRGDS